MQWDRSLSSASGIGDPTNRSRSRDFVSLKQYDTAWLLGVLIRNCGLFSGALASSG